MFLSAEGALRGCARFCDCIHGEAIIGIGEKTETKTVRLPRPLLRNKKYNGVVIFIATQIYLFSVYYHHNS